MTTLWGGHLTLKDTSLGTGHTACMLCLCMYTMLVPCSQFSSSCLQGSIPVDWGESGSFPNLQKLAVSFNHELNGTLPPSWGSDGSSFQNLTELHLTNNGLTGPLPGSWAGNLPALQVLNVSANMLTGTLSLAQSLPRAGCYRSM